MKRCSETRCPSDELLVYTRFNNCILAKPDGLEAVLRSLTSVTGSLRILLKYLLHGHLFGGWVPAGLSVLNECSGAFTSSLLDGSAM